MKIEEGTYGKGKVHRDLAVILKEADKNTCSLIGRKLDKLNKLCKELEKIENKELKHYVINSIRRDFPFKSNEKPYSYVNNIISTKLKILLKNE